MHLGSWRQGLSYRELADAAGRARAATSASPTSSCCRWPSTRSAAPGATRCRRTSRRRRGSATRTTSATSSTRLHQAGIGVIVDWVPAHFPKDAWALARFDGTALYEHPDPRRGEQPDWGTLRLRLRPHRGAQLPGGQRALLARGVPHRRPAGRRGRLDALPRLLARGRASGCRTSTAAGRTSRRSSFLQEVNATAYKRVPGIVTIAEESTAWPGVTRPTHLGGLGFGFKWNMGWMHDSLGYMANEPIYRQYHHHQMTFSMMYAYSENFVLPISHDEVVHGKGSLLRKMPGDRWQQLANLRAYLAFMWAHPGKQLLFMGSEFGQESEWAESRSLDWWLTENPDHRGVQTLVADLNRVYAREPGAVVAATPTPAASSGSTPTTRATTCSRSCATATTARCWPASRTSRRSRTRATAIGLPYAGRWDEVLNTDADATAAAASATSARSRPTTRAGTAGRPRRPCGCPPLGTRLAAPHALTPDDLTAYERGGAAWSTRRTRRRSTTRPASRPGGCPASCRPRASQNARELGRRRRDDGIDLVVTSDLAARCRRSTLAFAGADVPPVPHRCTAARGRLRRPERRPGRRRPRAAAAPGRQPFPGGQSYREVPPVDARSCSMSCGATATGSGCFSSGTRRPGSRSTTC